MRIAFYAPMKPPTHPAPSGDRRMGRLLMAALRQAGHSVTLASRLRSWDDGTRPRRQARIKAAGEAAARRLIARWGTAHADRRLDAWFTYHLYHKAPDWIGPTVSRALGIPYLIAEASHAPKQADGPWAKGLRSTEHALRQAAAVLAMTDEDMQGLRPWVPVDRLCVFTPFVDTAPYMAAAAERVRHRRDWWQGDGGPWLLAVGMMRSGDKLQSYRLLAAALDHVADLPWKLAIAGDGPERTTVAALFPEDRQRLLGMVAAERMPSLYAAADLLVWPAVNEAYGMAFLEAQAASLPIVAGADRAVPEIVADGVSGLLAPPGDVAGFASQVRRALTDPLRLQTLAEGGARRAADALDIKAAAVRLNGILRQACMQQN